MVCNISQTCFNLELCTIKHFKPFVSSILLKFKVFYSLYKKQNKTCNSFKEKEMNHRAKKWQIQENGEVTVAYWELWNIIFIIFSIYTLRISWGEPPQAWISILYTWAHLQVLPTLPIQEPCWYTQKSPLYTNVNKFIHLKNNSSLQESNNKQR